MQFKDRNLVVSHTDEDPTCDHQLTIEVNTSQNLSNGNISAAECYQFEFTENEWQYLIKQLTTRSN